MNKNYNFLEIPFKEYPINDKTHSIKDTLAYMFDRTQSMFEYMGLPETIPRKFLEMYLQQIGVCGITEIDGKLYAMFGGLGGKPDEYYFPTIFTVANPALNFSANLKIGEDVILMYNDTYLRGLLPIFSKYATLIAENEITIRSMLINTRIMSILKANDDSAALAAKQFTADIEAGKLSFIHDKSKSGGIFLENIETMPFANSVNNNAFSQLIEIEQYLKASVYNDIGLKANYNMKREALNSAETTANDDILLPLIDDMLRCRQECLKRVNERFGTDIQVKFNSAWVSDTESEPNPEPEPEPEPKGDDE